MPLMIDSVDPLMSLASQIPSAELTTSSEDSFGSPSSQITTTDDYHQSNKKKRVGRSGTRRSPNKWTKEEDEQLKGLVGLYGEKKWKKIAADMGGLKTGAQCAQHWKRVLCPDIKKGPWDEVEEEELFSLVSIWGPSWKKVAKRVKSRTDIQCRYQYLKAKQSRQIPWVTKEDDMLLKKTAEMGSSVKWQEVSEALAKAKHTPTIRTALECRNRFEALSQTSNVGKSSPSLLPLSNQSQESFSEAKNTTTASSAVSSSPLLPSSPSPSPSNMNAPQPSNCNIHKKHQHNDRHNNDSTFGMITDISTSINDNDKSNRTSSDSHSSTACCREDPMINCDNHTIHTTDVTTSTITATTNAHSTRKIEALHNRNIDVESNNFKDNEPEAPGRNGRSVKRKKEPLASLKAVTRHDTLLQGDAINNTSSNTKRNFYNDIYINKYSKLHNENGKYHNHHQRNHGRNNYRNNDSNNGRTLGKRGPYTQADRYCAEKKAKTTEDPLSASVKSKSPFQSFRGNQPLPTETYHDKSEYEYDDDDDDDDGDDDGEEVYFDADRKEEQDGEDGYTSRTSRGAGAGSSSISRASTSNTSSSNSSSSGSSSDDFESLNHLAIIAAQDYQWH